LAGAAAPTNLRESLPITIGQNPQTSRPRQLARHRFDAAVIAEQ